MIWTSLAAVLALGVCGGAAVWALAEPLATRLAHDDVGLRAETASALRILAMSVPSVVLSSALRGVLDAFGRFDLTNRVSIPIALLNLLAPVILLRFGASLPGIVSALLLLRLAGTLLLVRFVLHVVPALRSPRLHAGGLRSVLAFAGWVTVSNVAGPLFAQAERYFLGALAALSAVAFYSTPADVLTRVTVIPSAALQVLFPVLAQAVRDDRDRAARVANRSVLLIAGAVLPVLTLLVAVAPELLELWLGPAFAVNGARAGRILAIATFVNCMAWLPFSLVQSAGLARWTGKLHALEIPLYLAISALLIHAAGIDGAALANLLRATADGAVVVWMATRVLGPSGRMGRLYALLVAIGVVTMAGAAAPVALSLRLAWSVIALAAGGLVGWRLLDAEAREALSSRAAAAWARVGNVTS